MIAQTTPGRARLFLDSGVIIEGCLSPWGAAKAILILTTVRDRYTVVLAEAVEREVRRAMTRFDLGAASSAATFGQNVSGWLDRVHIERWPLPSDDVIREQAPRLLPVVRHDNDLLAVVTAVQSDPDWVVSSNTNHWGDDLAARTGLRVVSPQTLLSHLRIVDQH